MGRMPSFGATADCCQPLRPFEIGTNDSTERQSSDGLTRIKSSRSSTMPLVIVMRNGLSGRNWVLNASQLSRSRSREAERSPSGTVKATIPKLT